MKQQESETIFIAQLFQAISFSGHEIHGLGRLAHNANLN